MNGWTIAYTSKKEERIVISTTLSRLAWYGEYETAISMDGKDWRIVESYDIEEEAIKGHKKYTKMTKGEMLKLSYIKN